MIEVFGPDQRFGMFWPHCSECDWEAEDNYFVTADDAREVGRWHMEQFHPKLWEPKPVVRK